MVGYEVIEKAVISQLIRHFSTELNKQRVAASDIDQVFTAIQTEGATFGCVLELSEGGLRVVHPFREPVWVWEMAGVFLVRYEGDNEKVESNLRTIINKLPLLFENDPRLGGVTPLASVLHIGKPETITLNDIPFYWLFFVMQALDK